LVEPDKLIAVNLLTFSQKHKLILTPVRLVGNNY